MRGGDEGFGLAETLVGIGILGLGVVMVVSGMATSITVSDIGRSSAEAQIAVRSYAEQVTAESYVDCETSYPSFSPGSGYAASHVITYWNPDTEAFQATCPSPDSGLQRITLTVASDDSRATEVLPIIKRDRPLGET